MTYTEFRDKWLGKGIDYDGHYGNQCMDVYRQYVKEVLECPQSPPVQGAKNVWTTYLPEYFEKIENTPTAVPQQGDIVIWGMNPYGHIAICDHASTSTLTCFEQNWKELDGSGVTELRLHGNYNSVLGWLHFKEDMTEEQKRILDFIGTRSEGEVRQAFGALQDLPNLNKQIEDLQSSQKSLEDRIEQLEADAKANNELIVSWQTTASTANSKVSKLQEELGATIAQSNVWKNRYEAALKKTIDKYKPFELILMGIKSLFKK